MLFTCSMWLSGACLMRHIPATGELMFEPRTCLPRHGVPKARTSPESKQNSGVNYCFFNPNRLRCFEVRTTSIQGLSYVYKSQVKDPRQNTM